MTRFHDFFLERIEHGGFTTEDALTSLLPLIRQTAAAHAAGLVAPLQGLDALGVDGVRIFFDETLRSAPTLQSKTIETLERIENRALEVVGEVRFTIQVAVAQE